jgi:hypothetical protein
MAAVVNLQETVDELSMTLEEMRSYVDRETGEVVSVMLEDLSAAESGGNDERDDPDGEDDEIDTAVSILENPQRFERLPTQRDVNEWEIMHEFCEGVQSPDRRKGLLSAIRGSGAFRRFKDLATEYNILEDWYAFRDEALWNFARDWCEENDIPYTEKFKRVLQRGAADS